MFLLVLLLLFVIMYMSKTYLNQEPVTHERLGQLMMEGVCKDMSVRTCMELVKAGKVGLGRW